MTDSLPLGSGLTRLESEYLEAWCTLHAIDDKLADKVSAIFATIDKEDDPLNTRILEKELTGLDTLWEETQKEDKRLPDEAKKFPKFLATVELGRHLLYEKHVESRSPSPANTPSEASSEEISRTPSPVEVAASSAPTPRDQFKTLIKELFPGQPDMETFLFDGLLAGIEIHEVKVVKSGEYDIDIGTSRKGNNKNLEVSLTNPIRISVDSSKNPHVVTLKNLQLKVPMGFRMSFSKKEVRLKPSSVSGRVDVDIGITWRETSILKTLGSAVEGIQWTVK